MATYLVLAPYVTAAVSDANGAEVTLGFYEGGLIEDPVEGEHLDKLVRAGYIKKGSVPSRPGGSTDSTAKKAASSDSK